MRILEIILKNGRKTEIDVINGAVVRIAKEKVRQSIMDNEKIVQAEIQLNDEELNQVSGGCTIMQKYEDETSNEKETPSIVCPICQGTTFTILTSSTMTTYKCMNFSCRNVWTVD